jgi:hypothetical protein
VKNVNALNKNQTFGFNLKNMAVDHSADGSTISISSQDKRGQPQELYLEKSRTEMER